MLLVTGFCCLWLTVMAQAQNPRDDRFVSLPSPSDIKKVTIEPGPVSPYTPESLLKLLPRFVATGGVYLEAKFLQRGTIVLKNGKVLRWTALDNYSIELQSNKGARLFVMPAECSLTAPERRLPLRPRGGRIFHHSGHIFISNSSQGSAVALEYMPLEDKLDRPNAPGLSAEVRCVNGRASSNVTFKFWTTRRWPGEPMVITADGRVIKRLILHEPSDVSLEDLGLIVYSIDLPREIFLEMTEARKVQLLVGRTTFNLSADHLEALRDLASRMEV